MNKWLLQILLAGLLLAGCESQKGYDSIEELYKDSVVAIKTKDKAEIEKFVRTIIPDEKTAKYMRRVNYSYRGFPEGLKTHPHAIDTAIMMTTEAFYQFALELEEEYGSLDNLQFVGFEREIDPDPLYKATSDRPAILFEEIWGDLVFTGSNDSIPYKVGELLLVDGEWKAFTIRLGI